MNHESSHSEQKFDTEAGALLRDISALGRELRKNARAVLGNALVDAGLAPRDEFLVQTELLSRLADCVEDLEHRVAALEQRQASPPD